jgi:hypothetical protein
VHDYKATSIKLQQIDPADPKRRTAVMLSLAHVVRLVPQYYIEGAGGQRMVTRVDDDDNQTPQRGLKRYFLIFDDLGGQFESHTASEKGQAALEEMWHEAA